MRATSGVGPRLRGRLPPDWLTRQPFIDEGGETLPRARGYDGACPLPPSHASEPG
jgi:hypothetical protein